MSNIDPPLSEPMAENPKQFSIRALMALTAVVAVATALFRFATESLIVTVIIAALSSFIVVGLSIVAVDGKWSSAVIITFLFLLLLSVAFAVLMRPVN